MTQFGDSNQDPDVFCVWATRAFKGFGGICMHLLFVPPVETVKPLLVFANWKVLNEKITLGNGGAPCLCVFLLMATCGAFFIHEKMAPFRNEMVQKMHAVQTRYKLSMLHVLG